MLTAPDLAALRQLSAELGRDPAQVQAAGGNTSVKLGDTLWVKASGTWLAEAEARDIFVPVRLAPLRAALDTSAPASLEDVTRFVDAQRNPSGLRPSIETTMHAALPHPVILHVHCVDTIAWAVRADAEDALAPHLAGLRWALIRYIRPGAPLTLAILRTAPPGTDVLVLGNHGLVVGGATVQDAADRLAEVRLRLRREPRPAAPVAPGFAVPPALGDYRIASDPATHGLATDPLSLAVARLGSLYPDHVIFLGPGVTTLPDPRPDAPMILAPHAGVLLRDGAPPAVPALARCLADVAARLDPTEPIRVLDRAEEAALLGWDAEKYRQALASR